MCPARKSPKRKHGGTVRPKTAKAKGKEPSPPRSRAPPIAPAPTTPPAHPTAAIGADADYTVHVLVEGYSRWVSPIEHHAVASVTLLCGRYNILVDTGGPHNGDEVLQGVLAVGVSPEQVDFVVITHPHPDHSGNINLFPNAQVIMAHEIVRGPVFAIHNVFSTTTGLRLDERVHVVPTPGHSQYCVSVFVDTSVGRVVIAGDVFENEDDFLRDSHYATLSEDIEAHKSSRARIAMWADWIVPGHGAMFATRVARTSALVDTERARLARALGHDGASVPSTAPASAATEPPGGATAVGAASASPDSVDLITSGRRAIRWAVNHVVWLVERMLGWR